MAGSIPGLPLAMASQTKKGGDMKYKLLKDLPVYPAGTIFTLDVDDDWIENGEVISIDTWIGKWLSVWKRENTRQKYPGWLEPVNDLEDKIAHIIQPELAEPDFDDQNKIAHSLAREILVTIETNK